MRPLTSTTTRCHAKDRHAVLYCLPTTVLPTTNTHPQANLLKDVAQKVAAKSGVVVPYKIGTMIEVPRGALMAGQLASTAEFFSFGTNDLTQMTFGISRDDAQAKFLTFYTKHGLLPTDPFETLDQTGACCCCVLCV